VHDRSSGACFKAKCMHSAIGTRICSRPTYRLCIRICHQFSILQGVAPRL
jgi:hypothetical protein